MIRLWKMTASLLVLGLIWLDPGAAASGQSRQPAEHVVKVVSDLDAFRMYFSPMDLQIEPGDRVTWINQEAIDHNVMSYPDGVPAGAERFESQFLSQSGQTWSWTFERPGHYEYHCMPHLIMGMRGSIRVGDPAVKTSSHVPSAAEVRAYRDKLLEYFDHQDIQSFERAVRSIE